MDKWDVSDISLERKLEIDRILKESEKSIGLHDNSITLEEFIENIKEVKRNVKLPGNHEKR